jgi:two-component system response regulator YesN
VVILNLKYKTKINIKTLRKLKNKVQQKLNLSISCSFSEAADLKSLTNFYAEAKLALQKKLYLGKGKIISCHNLPNNKINFPADQEQYFLEELRLANKNSINNLLKKIFLEFTAVQASYENIKDIVLRIISLARAVMEELTTELEVELIYTDFYSEIDKYETIIEIKNWLGGLLNKFIDIIIEKREKQYSKSTKKAITYLKNNYQTTITLDNIAAEVYLSPNYFSKIFKLETGKNFTNWLNEYRIKKAKTIIQKEKSIKCYQLASRVGFNDYKYFSTTFKKYVKLSPSQYQQKINLN